VGEQNGQINILTTSCYTCAIFAAVSCAWCRREFDVVSQKIVCPSKWADFFVAMAGSFISRTTR
jgi:hypothetical protein